MIVDPDLMPVPSSWPKSEALFRSQIIAPLVDPLSTPEERTAWRNRVTRRSHTLPGGGERTVSERTLRRWVAQYRQAGLDGLLRNTHPLRSRLRVLTPDVIARAKELKRDEPRRSVAHIVHMIETERGAPLGVTPGALWRHLAKEGLGSRDRTPPEGLRRWESEGPNALWQSDVKYGPYLPDPLHPDTKQRTYLIVFLDDYSRLVPHAEWYFAQDVYALELCFQKALIRKGQPGRVYVDQGLIYQSQVFRLACAELGIRHIGATPYHPAAKGKVEKFIQTVDFEFLLELSKSPVTTLAEMNERFWAWLEEVYHRRVHRGTQMTPLARFAGDGVTPLAHPERLAEYFLWRIVRTVDKTGCVKFYGNVYQVEPGLERRKVELRYHPLHLQRLQVWIGETRYKDAEPLDLKSSHRSEVDPRHRIEEKAPPSLYLETLVRRHEERKRRIISPLQLAADTDAISEGDEAHV